MLLSRSIVNAVRSQNPPGRFLQKDSKTNKWFDVGDQRAQEKTSQALREGAPDIRKKAAGQTDKTEPTSTGKPTAATSSTDDTPTTTSKEPANNNTNVKSQPQQNEQPTPAQTPSAATAAAPHSHQGNPSVPQQPSNPYAGMGQFPMAQGVPGNGGNMMPNQFMQQAAAQGGGTINQQQGVFYYQGPNMQPIQMFPTMVLNEQGVMVPGMSMMPPNGMPAVNPTMPMMHAQPQVSGSGSAVTQAASNHHPNAQKQQSLEPLPIEAMNGNGGMTPTFDEFVAAAPEGLDGGGLSFGSAMMTDAEMMKLQQAGTSFGSVMSYRYNNQVQAARRLSGFNNGTRTEGDDAAPQALNGLEPTGLSFGDVSMMSAGTNRLEAGGTSFGTMMSYNTMPDGGLEAIGTSFGSLSLDAANRDQLFQQLELAGGGPEIPPMFNSEDKATGNLLECSDTESEDSQSRPDLVAQKSAAWERMQASVAQTKLQQSQSKGTVGSNELMPPPVGGRVGSHQGEPFVGSNMNGAVLSVPTTNFQRDMSQLSTWGDDHAYPGETSADDDDAAAPPPSLKKQGSDNEEELVGYISSQQV